MNALETIDHTINNTINPNPNPTEACLNYISYSPRLSIRPEQHGIDSRLFDNLLCIVRMLFGKGLDVFSLKSGYSLSSSNDIERTWFKNVLLLFICVGISENIMNSNQDHRMR